MSKKVLGDKREKEYAIPDIKDIARVFRSETLFLFGMDSQTTKYRWCLGDAIIVKVLDIDNQGKISLKKIGEQTEE